MNHNHIQECLGNSTSATISNEEISNIITNTNTLASRLIELNISGNLADVTAMGWETFSTALNNPNSVLRVFVPRHYPINDHAIIYFADLMLANNSISMLKRLISAASGCYLHLHRMAGFLGCCTQFQSIVEAESE